MAPVGFVSFPVMWRILLIAVVAFVFPNLLSINGAGSSSRIPSFTPWKCVHGTCDVCGIEKKHAFNQCILGLDSTIINLLEWKEVSQQGVSKNGKQNTQLELTRTQAPC